MKNVPPANDKTGPKFGTAIAMATMTSIKDVRMVMRCQLKSKTKKKNGEQPCKEHINKLRKFSGCSTLLNLLMHNVSK